MSRFRTAGALSTSFAAAALVAGVVVTPGAQAPGREVRRPCVPRSSSNAARPPRLLPHDDASRRPDFVEFRRMLLQAALRKDIAAILAVVHRDARVSFDGSAGPAAFKSLHVDDPDEEFWTEFPAILRMGGRFRTPTEFDAPYTFANWPDGVESFECLAVIGTGVRLREKPTTRSQPLAVLSYDIVQQLIDAAPVAGWEHVTTPDGISGFVASRYLRSPIDHRAMFAYQDGRWWLMAYLAGD
jgi:hypothetical protein